MLFSMCMMMSTLRTNLFLGKKFICKGTGFFYCRKNNLSCNIIPRCCDNRCITVMLLKQLNTFCQFTFRKLLCTADNDCSCTFYLIIEEFTKILHIHLCLQSINYCCSAVKNNISTLFFHYFIDSLYDIRQFSHS